jgi:PDZ domain-containing protein
VHTIFGMPRSIAITLIVVFLIVVAGVVSAEVQVPYYAITPGVAQNVNGLIQLPSGVSYQHAGGVYLTDVYLKQLTALEYPIFEIDSQASIVSSSDVIGFVPVAEYNVEGEIDMSDATQAATYVALDDLGYKVTAAPEGVQLYEVDPVSNTYSALSVGDVITGVDGHPVLTEDQLSPLLMNDAPGTVVHVTYRSYAAPLAGPQQTVPIALGEYRNQDQNPRCYPVGKGTQYPLVKLQGEPYPFPCLGVEIYAFFKLGHLPFAVTIDPQGIVGPSAGLAFTLGLLNELDPSSLTGGRKIAATGTMSLDGSVGAVGGVAQKTIAVENAGATVFFVPQDNYAAAISHANKSLTVVSVTSLSQALSWLLSHGGKLTIPSAPKGTS